jgi:hypothetical protein
LGRRREDRMKIRERNRERRRNREMKIRRGGREV